MEVQSNFGAEDSSIVVDGMRCSLLSTDEIKSKKIANAQVYSKQIEDYITAGDTIRVMAGNDCRSFIGQVVDVSPFYKPHYDPYHHPFVRDSMPQFMVEEEEYYIKVKIYIPREHDIFANGGEVPLPAEEPSMQRLEISEVVETNVGLWISVRQIYGIIYILHQIDCQKEKYGSVYRRNNTFYTSYKATLSSPLANNGNIPSVNNINYVPRNKFRRFGPHTGCRSTSVTTTERRLNTISNMYRVGEELLRQSGQCGTSAKSITQPMQRDCWHYILDNVSEHIICNVLVSVGSQRITNPNLTVGRAIRTDRTESITIRDMEGFDSLRWFISHTYGIRPSMPHPSLQANHTSVSLHGTDRLNLIEMALHPVCGDMEEEYDRQLHNANYIRLCYNFRTQQCKTTIKSMVMVANPQDDRMRNLIDRFQINLSGNGGCENLRVGHYFEWGDDEWQIDSVQNGTIVAHVRDENDRTINLSVNEYQSVYNVDD